MAIRQVHGEQDDLVRQALEAHPGGLDVADALHLLRSEGCGRFASFERALASTATALAVGPPVELL